MARFRVVDVLHDLRPMPCMRHQGQNCIFHAFLRVNRRFSRGLVFRAESGEAGVFDGFQLGAPGTTGSRLSIAAGDVLGVFHAPIPGQGISERVGADADQEGEADQEHRNDPDHGFYRRIHRERF